MTSPTRARTAAVLAAALVLPAVAAAAPGAAPAGGPVLRLHDHRIAELRAPLDGVPPAERARRASEALGIAFDAGARGASVRAEGGAAVVLLGTAPILAVGPEDAAAAGVPDAAAAAAALAAGIDRAVRDEVRRQAAQGAVFALSMLVFSGLVAFLLARRLGAVALGWAERIEAGDLPVAALAVGGVEVASAGFLRGALPVALRIGRFLSWLAILYGWLLFSASLSERTRALGGRLARAVVEPAAATVVAVGRALPMAVAVAIGAAIVGVVLRATRLWFDALARGDATSPWIDREHARSTGALVRGTIVVLALLAAPGLLGAGEAGVGRVGLAALAALALGATPIAASLLLGVIAVYGRTLRPGDEAEVGGRRGRVREVTLREVVLEDADGGVVRVPHLVTLLHPTRVGRRR